MDSSQRIVERFQLQLTPSWQEWFDQPPKSGALPGLMRELVSADELTSARPRPIWPGFMLPDTLPVLGNEYGDYVCVRVGEQDQLGELIYWYHGGGDWIPVGTTIAEAILHDAVDRFRDIRTQMIRGASESRIGQEASSLLSLDDPAMRDWFCRNLPQPHEGSTNDEGVTSIIHLLSEENYEAALREMLQRQWAKEAVACDLMELWLQRPLRTIASRDFAKACGVAWFPDFVRLLFDIESGSKQARETIFLESSKNGTVIDEKAQDWHSASELAKQILRERKDLAWATVVQGWNQERSGETQEAIATYQQGIEASSFTEQSVRLNSHAESDEYGKFALARLKRLESQFGIGERIDGHDQYLALLLGDHRRSILQEVSAFWMQKATEAEAQGKNEIAYDHFYSSGWDMGVSRISEYETILAGLARNAKQAGWNARAAVAELHLSCLQKTSTTI
ncbi:MAG: hypothetical protein ACE361_09440 [Aureliella sp.]